MQFLGVAEWRERNAKKIGYNSVTVRYLWFMAFWTKLIWTWSNSLFTWKVINFSQEISTLLAPCSNFTMTTACDTIHINLPFLVHFLYVSFTPLAADLGSDMSRLLLRIEKSNFPSIFDFLIYKISSNCLWFVFADLFSSTFVIFYSISSSDRDGSQIFHHLCTYISSVLSSLQIFD